MPSPSVRPLRPPRSLLASRVVQIKRQLLKEHHRTWRRNGLKSLNYEFVDAVALGDACTKFRVDLGLNGHWSDDHATLNPPEQQHDEPRHASQAPPASTSLDSVISIQ
jgi:hypothetical protein